jgi:hypothetical protein
MDLKYLQLGDVIIRVFYGALLMRLNIAKKRFEQLYNSGNMIILLPQLMNFFFTYIYD